MKKILLIEDNKDMRENIGEILELAHYEVFLASNGKEGVRLAQDVVPDVIICDIMMPEMDGYGVLRILSKEPITAGIPFIFLTAKAEKSDIRKGMNMGADDYLTKPFDDSELLEAIEMRLKKNDTIKQNYENTLEGLNELLHQAHGWGALEKLSEDRETRFFKPKSLIYQEGSFPVALIYIKTGKVKTYKTNEDAKELIVGLHKAGDFLGYIDLLQETAYTESAEAIEDTEILMIPKKDFLDLIYNDRILSHKFIKLLAQNLQEKEFQLLHLAYDTVRKRVADALLLLQNRYKADGKTDFSMAISRDNLASIVGTSKECVIRVLSEFKDEGIINTQMSTITITDSNKLKRIRY